MLPAADYQATAKAVQQFGRLAAEYRRTKEAKTLESLLALKRQLEPQLAGDTPLMKKLKADFNRECATLDVPERRAGRAGSGTPGAAMAGTSIGQFLRDQGIPSQGPDESTMSLPDHPGPEGHLRVVAPQLVVGSEAYGARQELTLVPAQHDDSTVRALSDLQRDAVALQELHTQLAEHVETQHGMITGIEDQMVHTHEQVKEGNRELYRAAQNKAKHTTWKCAAIGLGTGVVGGGVGALCIAPVACLATGAAAGTLLGTLTGKVIKRRQKRQLAQLRDLEKQRA